jgi:hypothetical protein
MVKLIGWAGNMTKRLFTRGNHCVGFISNQDVILYPSS